MAIAFIGGLGFLVYWVASNIKSIEPATNTRAEEVESLGYINSVPDADPREGVVHVEPDAVQPGLTIMTSAGRETTYLVDLDGTVVQQWHSGPGTYAAIDEAGFLIALSGELLKLDWDSNEVWSRDIPVHHDVWLGEEQIISIDRYPELVDGPLGETPILADGIVILNNEGRLKHRIPVWSFAGELIPRKRFDAIDAYHRAAKRRDPEISPLDLARPDTPSDVFHTNSVSRIDQAIEGVAEPGDLLVSVRELHLVAVVRPQPDKSDQIDIGAEIIWQFAGELQFQHHATLLKDGHFMIYDNGRNRGYTRAIEIDPSTQEIVWEYNGTPERSLFSGRRGSAQRLPNGNTLIAESDRGRIIEVTTTGDVVWEYLMHKQDEQHREPVYRAIRITDPLAALLREKAAQHSSSSPR